MDVLRVAVALLRAQLPDLVLRPGMTLPARVIEREGRFGVLLLAGTPLSAELPETLQAGDRLRLRVEEIGADRVLLRTVEAPAAPPAAAAGAPRSPSGGVQTASSTGTVSPSGRRVTASKPAVVASS